MTRILSRRAARLGGPLAAWIAARGRAAITARARPPAPGALIRRCRGAHLAGRGRPRKLEPEVGRDSSSRNINHERTRHRRHAGNLQQTQSSKLKRKTPEFKWAQINCKFAAPSGA